jgi:EAL domain-containing protein (putative c-di-GMP-specific phosphodiesterase class I)
LNLEITENVVMSDALSTVSIRQELRELGVKLSIDDFGTGYSSLAYLKRFPVDFLKVDRSFVGHIGEDGGTEDLLIISGIVSLARNLVFTVIAEGVETIDQLERLQELGCDLAQGYYFSKPLPGPEIEDLLSEIGASGEPGQAGAEALRPLPGSAGSSGFSI